MSESLRNDGRVWAPKNLEDAVKLRKGIIGPNDIKDEDRDFYLERRYPSYGNLVPRDVASRAAKPTPALSWNIYNLASEHEAASQIRHVQYGMVLALSVLCCC